MAPADVIVLLQNPTSGHPTGHQAVLIGDDEKGWYLYSKDGSGSSAVGASGPGHSTIDKHFNSLEEFATSSYNTFKEDYADGKGMETSERDANGDIRQRFDRGYRIKTDGEADDKMKEAAGKNAQTDYILGFADCTFVVKAAMDAGGLKNGERSDVIRLQGRSDIPYMTQEMNYTPKAKQTAIEQKNKGGRVDAQLKLNQ